MNNNKNMVNYSLSVRIVLIYNNWRNKALSNLKSNRKRFNSDGVLVKVRSFEIKSDEQELEDLQSQDDFNNYLYVPQKPNCGQRRASCSPNAECSLNSIITYFHGCRGQMLRLPCDVQQLGSMHYKSEDRFSSSSSDLSLRRSRRNQTELTQSRKLSESMIENLNKGS